MKSFEKFTNYFLMSLINNEIGFTNQNNQLTVKSVFRVALFSYFMYKD